jgi:[acyl-carrier-protein] S-malonyltransferase
MHRLGIVFPGQGAQYVGMGRDLHDGFEVVRSTFSEAGAMLGFDVASLCFEGPQEQLDLTANTQTTILTLNAAVYRVFKQETPLRPRVMAGHSLGEYSALCASGALSFPDALELVRTRSRHQQEVVPVGVGSMAAVIGLERAAVESLCREISGKNGVVVPAIFNAPDQTVVSGLTAAVDSVMSRAKEEGAKRAIRLPLSVPFHCPLLVEAARRFREDLGRVEIRNGDIPVLTNVDPAVIHRPHNTKELLIAHISAPVRWQETIEQMILMGVDTIVEMGPRKILSGLTKRIDSRIRMLNVEDRDSLKKTLESLNE